MDLKKYNLVCILGPTASGKTTLAAELAYRIKGEIISADSRQVYKEMNIGTGKDLEDYVVNNIKIPYHLIDIVEPGYEYNVYEFQQDFLNAYQAILSRQNIPVLCGGSGLYIEAVLDQYELINVPINKELREQLQDLNLEELNSILSNFRSLHNTTDSLNKKRAIRAIEIEEYYSQHAKKSFKYPELDYVIFGISLQREDRRNRITERLISRLQNGMIEEVENLLKSGISETKLEFYGLEYKFLSWYLSGKIDYNEMFKRLNTAIHQFSKRQMTWYRRMERKGFKINWIEGNIPIEKKIENCLKILE